MAMLHLPMGCAAVFLPRSVDAPGGNWPDYQMSGCCAVAGCCLGLYLRIASLSGWSLMSQCGTWIPPELLVVPWLAGVCCQLLSLCGFRNYINLCEGSELYL